MFEDVDTDKVGELTYKDFHSSFKAVQQYNLSDTDVHTLLALADENPNGKITWADFIPVGIKAVQIFLERNAYLETLKASQKEVNKETLKLVYEFEIKKAA